MFSTSIGAAPGSERVTFHSSDTGEELTSGRAHRTNIVRSLKGLEDIIQVAVMGFRLTQEGWTFDGSDGTMEKDPLYGFTHIRQLYWKADPEYKQRYTVPMLWDKKKETIVSNESSEIIRMFYTEFDDLLSPENREVNKPGGGFYPEHLRKEIDTMNEWVYNTVNNGVYKTGASWRLGFGRLKCSCNTGFASTQEAYEENVFPLFRSLDRLEEHLSKTGHQPFLFGDHITEADIRLYPTLVRFDTACKLFGYCEMFCGMSN